MSNNLFSDDGSDPPVDKELRDVLQRFSVGPTAEEQTRFWADLSEKLPEQKASAHLFAPSTFKRYLPWTALASGVAVVLLLLVLPGEKSTRQAALSDKAELQSVPAAESFREANSDADYSDVEGSAEPMILGAAPAAKRARQQKTEQNLSKQAFSSSPPFGLSTPDFSVRWEPVSETVFLVHISASDRERLMRLAKNWSVGLVLTEVTERSDEKKLSYRLEDKR